MDGSFLHRIKFVVHSLLPLSGDAILILLGLSAYLATSLLSRHPLTWAWALLPGVGIALFLEAWEIWDHYGRGGLSELDRLGIGNVLVRHSRDILIINIGPFAVFLTARGLQRFSRR